MNDTDNSETSDDKCVKCGEPFAWVICSTPLGPMHRSCFDAVYEIYPTYLPISGCFDPQN